MSYTCSTPRSTSGISIANSETCSVIDDVNEYDKHLLHEGNWMLSGNLEIVTPEEFLKIHFKENELLEDDNVFLKNCLKQFRKIKIAELTHEKHMYDPLVKPINFVLAGCRRPGESYKCYRRDSKRSIAGHDAGIKVALAPDLVITPNTKNLDKKATVFSQPMIAIEAKLDQWYNPALRAGNHSDVTKGDASIETFGPVIDASNLTNSQKKLIFQMMRYAILGQFGTLPHRHLFFITITGRKLRIWKFSPTGCLVTSTIDYLTEIECNPFVQFLYAIGSGPVSHFGVDIGEGMMFQEVSEHYQRDRIHKRLEAMKDLYFEQSKDSHWEKHLSTEPGYWLFRLDIPSKNHYNRTSSIVPGDNHRDSTQIHPQSESESHPEGVTLIVFRRPIFRANHIFSRATRCYLGIELDFLVSTQFKKASAIEQLQRMHTIKTAWQFVSRTPEVEFHRRFAERHALGVRVLEPTAGGRMDETDHDEPVDALHGSGDRSGVATVLAGGIIPNSCQFRGRLVPEDPADRSQPIQIDDEVDSKPQDFHKTEAQESPSQSDSQGGRTQNGGLQKDTKNASAGGLFSQLTARMRNRRSEKSVTVATEVPINVKQEYLDALAPPAPATPASQGSEDKDQGDSYDEHTDQHGDEKSQPRELHWLVYKEVGGRLGAVSTVKEFAQVLIDILHAHRALYEADILHRDISGNNVMVDLATFDPESNTRRGLLIDLDVAKDLREVAAKANNDILYYDVLEAKPLPSTIPSKVDEVTANMEHRRPEITGTLHWMSIALYEGAEHRAWHDIESVFWLIVYYTLRHVEGIKYDEARIVVPMDRAKTIDGIFCRPTSGPSQSIRQMSQAKKGFLDLLLEVAGCRVWADMIAELQVAFRDFYHMLGKIDRLENDIKRLEPSIYSSNKVKSSIVTTATTTDDELAKTHYSANVPSDISDHLSLLSRRVLENQLSDTESRRAKWDKVLQDVDKMHCEIPKTNYAHDNPSTSTSIHSSTTATSTSTSTATFTFPTYELVLEKLQMVLTSEEAERAHFIPFEPPSWKTGAHALASRPSHTSLHSHVSHTSRPSMTSHASMISRPKSLKGIKPPKPKSPRTSRTISLNKLKSFISPPTRTGKDPTSDSVSGTSRKHPRSVSRPPPNQIAGQKRTLDEPHADSPRNKRHHK